MRFCRGSMPTRRGHGTPCCQRASRLTAGNAKTARGVTGRGDRTGANNRTHREQRSRVDDITRREKFVRRSPSGGQVVFLSWGMILGNCRTALVSRAPSPTDRRLDHGSAAPRPGPGPHRTGSRSLADRRSFRTPDPSSGRRGTNASELEYPTAASSCHSQRFIVVAVTHAQAAAKQLVLLKRRGTMVASYSFGHFEPSVCSRVARMSWIQRHAWFTSSKPSGEFGQRSQSCFPRRYKRAE